MGASDSESPHSVPTGSALPEPKPMERAKSDDTWFRPITNSKDIKRRDDGRLRIHHSYFGRFDGPTKESAPYKAELSGRLRSLAGTADEIRANGREHANRRRERMDGESSSIVFAGIASATVKAIRNWSFVQSDVYHSPTGTGLGRENDRAHADLVMVDKNPKDVVAFKDQLAEQVSITPEPELELFLK